MQTLGGKIPYWHCNSSAAVFFLSHRNNSIIVFQLIHFFKWPRRQAHVVELKLSITLTVRQGPAV